MGTEIVSKQAMNKGALCSVDGLWINAKLFIVQFVF